MKQLIRLVMVLNATCVMAGPVAVQVSAEHGMIRGGAPYFVKGAGGDTHLDMLAARGGNSLRTWTSDGLAETLDTAHKLGLTVSAGIWLEPECSWFSYANPKHCARQTDRVRKVIMEHRDHPALLAWGLGNEVEGDGGNTGYWQQLETLALLVKELDPAHPTYTAVAGLSRVKARGLDQYTPHLDYVGVNTYGGLFGLRKSLEAMGWKRPWMLTEWGPQGFWERPRSKSGAPLEQTSTEKAAMMARGYDEVIAKGGACLGSYAFVWGWKFEATATWFGLLTEDVQTTQSTDVLEERWSGRKPSNTAPRVKRMEGVPTDAVRPGTPLLVKASASDPDGDVLHWRWLVLPEKPAKDSAGHVAMPAAVPGTVPADAGEQTTLTAPTVPGAYRVYVWINDGKGHTATANEPLEVR